MIQTTAYSIIQPAFEKIISSIGSCKTTLQLEACDRMIENFSDSMQSNKDIKLVPAGFAREVLLGYYREELNKAYRQAYESIEEGSI